MVANTSTNSSSGLEGTDFSQYRNWKVVKTPSGGTYYQVPGTGFVYDPFTSQAKGKPVLFRNPQPQLDEQQRQIDLQNKASDPLNQLVPVAGSVGGLVAGKLAIDAIGTGTAAATAGTTAGAGAAGAGAATGAGAGAATGAGVAGAAPAAPVIVGGGAPAAAAPGFIGSGAAGIVVPAVVAGTTYLAGKSVYDMLKGKEDNSAAGMYGRASLAIATGGLSEVVRPFLGHKSTKKYQKERWGQLEKDGIANAAQIHAINHPEGDDSIWDTGKYAGQKWTMEKALDLAKEDPRGFHHVLGNYKTFGNDWSGYDEQKKSAIVSALVNEGLYKSDKGDVLISDEKKAREIKDKILGGQPVMEATTKPEKLPAPVAMTKDQEMGKQLAERMNKRVR